MPASSPLSHYRRALSRGFHPDAAQERAALALEDCHQALHGSGSKPRGVYLWGPVGRGKTWLMDGFHRSLGVPARRQHFHHFMRWVHRRLHALSGTPEPLAALADELAAEARVLCFDELFIADIGDAMLLGGLLQALFARGLVLVATSNQPPAELYKDGFNRERLMPALAALERHMHVLAVDGDRDHRLYPGRARTRYWVKTAEGGSALEAAFAAESAGLPESTEPLELGRREIAVRRRSDKAVWLDYAELCGAPLAALDFIELCERFPAILLGEVPALSGRAREPRIARGTEDGAARVAAGDRVLPALSPRDDGVRRFIALVDECYDRRRPLFLEAAVPLDELYVEGGLEFPFRRALSRLKEMQLERFGAA
ncbi:MAG: cell division protein ZapE [Gammaproteobacteria bacterium]|nr:cell division protein ZapE [Gammaproteobacteria bacterium]